MKKEFFKGHPLTENETREVKGGAWYAIKVVTEPYEPPKAFNCDLCGHRIYLFGYNADNETYTAVCENCGCGKYVKVEDE